MNGKENIQRIKAVYNALEELKDAVVFVGGATVSLYADRQTTQIRPTDDVDIVVEISSRRRYIELEQQLRDIGFRNDTSAGFVGRYLINDDTLGEIVVDFMATEEGVLGFSNRWYTEGFATSFTKTIDEQTSVRIFSAPIFIATKLEAFKNRGNGDGRTSSDFEDIVYVLENREIIWEEMKDTSAQLKEYLRSEFTALLQNPYCQEWIGANSDAYPPSSYYIMSEMRNFVNQ